jgi:hypothetical protein
MSRTFVVQNSPNNEYALSHLVYMNPIEVGAPYTTIGRFVYRCAAHADVPRGYIAMNAIQRRDNIKVVGDPVQVEDFLIPMTGFNITTVSLKATWLMKNIDAPMPPNLANKFRTDFEGYVLTKGQKLTANYEDEIVYFTVTSEGRGLLTANSEVSVHWEA